MPIYLYKNKKTNEHREILQGMNDVHEYFGENGGEDCWQRVFTVPTAGIDTNLDPYSKNDFMRNTEGKKETLGSLWERSQELSEKRKDDQGSDPVKDKFYDNYSKERNGQIHPEKKKADLKKSLSEKGINLDT